MTLRRTQLVALWIVCLGCLSWAMKEYAFNPPKAFHAKTYPAHDAHDSEKVSIAADPYDMPEKTANVFTVAYKKEGFLPIHFIVSNDGDQPISLMRMKAVLITKF